MTHFATRDGAYSPAQAGLAAAITCEPTMFDVGTPRPDGLPTPVSYRLILLLVPETFGFETDERSSEC